jgi:hypothetical protein
MPLPSWISASGGLEDVCATSEQVGRGEIDRWLPEELARLHNQFERVHPFIDGNGRAGRLVMNLVLVRLGYPPVIVFKRQRSAYLAAMQRADGGDYGALGELIAQATALAGDDFSAIALRRAAQRGRLDAVQGPDAGAERGEPAPERSSPKAADRADHRHLIRPWPRTRL